MELTPKTISEEFKKDINFKASLGEKGMFEQNRINERFYIGDQWYGARSANDRPLVRHNIIKRIGEYKIAQVISKPIKVEITAEGVPTAAGVEEKKSKSSNDFNFSGNVTEEEISKVMSALTDYRETTARRLGFEKLCCDVLKKAYISGTGVLYTYFDDSIKTGLYADKSRNIPINGDIRCEVLGIENICFADPFEQDIESQPYIIISNYCDYSEAAAEAEKFGAGKREIMQIKPDRNGKVRVYTKLFKETDGLGKTTVKCIKVTDSGVVRPVFNTRLTLYPISLIRWEERGNSVYGESEVTYLVSNQIAINRMITASVWATMSKGMPLMVVNGDTVPEEITNDPGQIIKVYGSNEDVAGAVKFIDPPNFSADFISGVNDLIKNTLTQSGANEVALGDSKAENATALSAMQNAASLPLIILKNKFYNFIENVTRIWADFWVTQYGNRRIKIENNEGVSYVPFCAERYQELYLSAKIIAGEKKKPDPDELKLLGELFDKKVITKKEYLERLPKDYISGIDDLIKNSGKDEGNDSL